RDGCCLARRGTSWPGTGRAPDSPDCLERPKTRHFSGSPIGPVTHSARWTTHRTRHIHFLLMFLRSRDPPGHSVSNRCHSRCMILSAGGLDVTVPSSALRGGL